MVTSATNEAEFVHGPAVVGVGPASVGASVGLCGAVVGALLLSVGGSAWGGAWTGVEVACGPQAANKTTIASAAKVNAFFIVSLSVTEVVRWCPMQRAAAYNVSMW